METLELPKGVKVQGISGKSWRGEIPVKDCQPAHLKKFSKEKPPTDVVRGSKKNKDAGEGK